jgi:hypothetical protein
MLTGTVRQTGRDWYVDHSYPKFGEPAMITVSWRVIGGTRKESYGPAPELAPGLTVQCEIGAKWYAYDRGNYLILDTEHEGTVAERPLPCPKVRAGVETRYHDGRWEKYLKARGWVAA